MSECDHGLTYAHAVPREDGYNHPVVRCPGPSVVTPPAQDEQRCPNGHTAVALDDRGDKFCTICTAPIPAAPSVSTDHTDEKEIHMRSDRREDGWPTRSDIRYDTDAERLIRIAMQLVEGMGASDSLTRAVVALDAARNHVADHVETAVR